MALPPTSPRTAADSIGLRVEAQMTWLLYRRASASAVANVLLAIALVPGLGPAIAWRTKGSWLAAVLILSLARYLLGRFYDRDATREAAQARWRRRYILGAVASGLLWGWAGWYFFLPSHLTGSLLLVIILAGLTAGASRSMAAVPPCFLLFLVAALLPIASRFLTVPAGGWLLCLITVLYALFLLRDSLMQHQDLVRLHRLNFQYEASLEELKVATARAEASNRAKSDFLATISHEIRTPMNGVIGMLQILRDGETTGQQHAQINTALGSARALLRLLNDVLDFAKIESGKLAIEAVPFAPAEVLGEITALLRPSATQKQLAFNLALPPGPPLRVVGDPFRLKQVLLNLASNAIKFTEQGRVDLGMTVTSADAQRVTIHFRVRDTGIGIDADTQGHLFQAFAQGDRSTTRRFGGSGLGLAISQRLVGQMGSRITLDSAKGQGATFAFDLTLPLAPEAATAPAEPVAAATPPMSPLRGRVLVAEDDPVSQRVITLMLERLGLGYAVARTGTEAAALAQDESWNAVLMDCHMPEMDGYAATRVLRQRPRRSHLPVIALTANAAAEERSACLAAGMDDFLTKPVNTQELRACLQRWLPEAGNPTAP